MLRLKNSPTRLRFTARLVATRLFVRHTGPFLMSALVLTATPKTAFAAIVDDLTVRVVGGGGLIVLVALCGLAAFFYIRSGRRTREVETLQADLAAQRIAHVDELTAAAAKAMKTEAALQENEQRIRDFAESASDWFWETDEDHRFCFFSQTAVARLEMKDDLAYGKTRWDLALEGEEDSEFWTRHRLDVEAHREIKNFIYPLGVDDGSLRYVRVDGMPVFDDKGRFTGYRGVGRNITEDILTQMSTREAKDLFKKLVEGSWQGVMIHVDFKPVFANQAYATIFGYDSVDAVLALDSQMDLIAEEEHDRLVGYRTARLSGSDAPQIYEFVGIRKDGSKVRVRNRVSLVSWEGKTGVLTMVLELSDETPEA